MGVKWFADFNCILFYSTENLTERDVLTAIYGCSPEEHERKEKEYFDRLRRKEEEFKRQMPKIISEYIEKGHEILPTKYHAEWDKLVPVRVSDLYHGIELQSALDIIKILDKGDFEKARKEFEDQGHSGMSASITRSIVRKFCNNGEMFCEMTTFI